ncbi:MAG: hypothetical protein Q7T03_01070 [Deltaproteobacteria bacterium]|nr:hypothetical protein [Deltaproteobacteria bacterium]
MTYFKKGGFVFSFLFLLILQSTQAGTITKNQIPPIEKQFLENLLSKRVTYILGFGHPSPALDAFFKEQFNDPQFRYGYPYIVTVNGKIPSNILEKMNSGAAAKAELEKRVKQSRGLGEDAVAGFGIMAGMAQFCEFQKKHQPSSRMQSSSQVMGRTVPEGMRLFGVCPSDPQQCNQASGRERYREGSNMFTVGDKEECKNDRQSGVAGGDAEQRMKDQMDKHQREQGVMTGKSDPCAPPEEETGSSNAVASKVAGSLPNRSYAASGGGGKEYSHTKIVDEPFTMFGVQSQKTRIYYEQVVYRDGTKAPAENVRIYEGKNVRIYEGKNNDSNNPPPQEQGEGEPEKSREDKRAELIGELEDAREKSNQAQIDYNTNPSDENFEKLEKAEETTNSLSNEVYRTKPITGGSGGGLPSAGQCPPDSSGCDEGQGPELSARTKQIVDQLKQQNPMNRPRADKRVIAGNPGLEGGGGGGLPSGPSLTDRWGAAGNPGIEGTTNGSLGMNCDCKGKCGATPTTGFGTGGRRDPCLYSNDENCGRGEGPSFPGGEGGAQGGGGQPGGGVPIPK